MDWNTIPQEEPSIIFPIGAIIEDNKGRYKIEKFEKQKFAHKYKVEIIELWNPPPQEVSMFFDRNNFWLLVLPQNLNAIKRIA